MSFINQFASPGSYSFPHSRGSQHCPPPRINTPLFPPPAPDFGGEQGKVSTHAIEVKMVQWEVLDHSSLSV